jgi:phosphatidylserine/phosphatidylglycerophosphate/cardiolipin synthase-like enzyme
VEHVFLAALVNRPRSVAELASQADVPRRLALEVVIRLMRAGWVVLSQTTKGVVFSASPAGVSVAGDEELPHISVPMSRWMNFVIDKVTGTLYRSRELPFLEKHVVQQRAQRERLVWMEARNVLAFDETADVLSVLFEGDEKFLGVEPAGDRLVDRFAVVTVRNGAVEGLPARAPMDLQKLVLNAAAAAPDMPLGERSPSFRPAPQTSYADREPPAPIEVAFHPDDVILGGAQHHELFTHLLRRARRRVIVHSTFIADVPFSAAKPLMVDAVKRGAVVDILWGEDATKTSSTSTRAAVARIRQEIIAAGLEGSFRVHPFSTRSHAKIVVADDGAGRTVAVVGSCNWLSSAYQTFDVSVRLSDPRLVAVIIEQLAELTRGSDGHWTDLTTDFARTAADVRGQQGPSGTRAKMAVVLGPQHSHYIRKARDTSREHIFVLSHLMGAATRPAVIVPAIAAARDRGIRSHVYYGVQSGLLNADVAGITRGAATDGVDIRPVLEPRLHAKVLSWDDDYLLITSQNWLSADPSEANVRREIGVFINAPGVARNIVQRFEAARQG